MNAEQVARAWLCTDYNLGRGVGWEIGIDLGNFIGRDYHPALENRSMSQSAMLGYLDLSKRNLSANPFPHASIGLLISRPSIHQSIPISNATNEAQTADSTTIVTTSSIHTKEALNARAIANS